MQQNLNLRLLIAAGMLAGAAYFLAPSVVYFSLDEESLAEVRRDKDAFKTHVPSWMPETHIVPGLDLQGGIHMVLGIDLEKAISDRARRTANRVRNVLDDKKVKFKAVDHLPEEGAGDRIRMQFNDKGERDKFDEIYDDFFQRDLVFISTGDTELLLRVHPDFATTLRKEAVDQTVTTINNRIDKMGVTEPSIAKRGDDQIQIQLPGYDDPEEAKSLIGRTAQLEFQMLDDDANFMVELTDLPEGVELQRSGYNRPGGAAGSDIFFLFGEDQKEAVRKYLSGKVPSGRVVKFGKLPARLGEEVKMRTYTLLAGVDLTGDDLVDARVQPGSPENPGYSVGIDFSPAGGKAFGDLTSKNIGKRMAIVLEDNVQSAPVIQTAITGGSAQITMGGGAAGTDQLRDANQLALVLKAGALPAPVQFREERSVGPSLGKESVERGWKASLLGAFLIVLFMVFYYRLAGIIAIIGIGFNVLFVLASLSALGGTVTLPGVAGLLLTVGMAVDANIIIIERIREELRAGKTPRSAVASGYDSAFSAIIDANVTTFIAGTVLYQYGTGPIQNFAAMLIIGTVSSVISAVFITRIFFDWVVRKGPESISV